MPDRGCRWSRHGCVDGECSVVQNTNVPTENVSGAPNVSAPARHVSAVQNPGAPTGQVSTAQNANASARNVSAVQNPGVPTGQVSTAQNANASARNVSAVQNPGVPAKATAEKALMAQPAAPPEPLPVREASVRDPSPTPIRGLTGFLRGMRVAGSRLARLALSPSVRLLTFFGIGVAATLAWQSYRDVGTEAITSWCGRWAPQAASAAQVSPRSEDLVPVSPDQLKVTSLNLAAVRESIDKVATELSRLQTIEKLANELTRLQFEHAAPDRTSAPSPLVPPPPPASRPPSRPAPAH
jgi:hypothetical protein